MDEDGCPIIAEGRGNEEDNDPMMMTGMMGSRQSTLMGGPESDTTILQNSDGNVCTNASAIATPEVRLRNAAIANDITALEEVIGTSVCDIDDADESGQTALHFAADRESLDCLKLLVDRGANVNAVDIDGIGVLQTALCAGLPLDAVRLLLEAGADPEACDCDGDSPRMWVSEEGDEAMVELFAAFPAR